MHRYSYPVSNVPTILKGKGSVLECENVWIQIHGSFKNKIEMLNFEIFVFTS